MFDKGALKKIYTKMEKGREANENILMEEKYHGMRKVRVLVSENSKEQTCAVRGKRSS